MFFVLLQVIALLRPLLIKAQSINACDSGWFGKGCLYQCHCSTTLTCGADGECSNNGKCEEGYFGPGCQYVDYTWNMTLDNEQYLIDEDESTCNSHKDATDVTITFFPEIVLTWFRVYVKYPNVQYNFSVVLDESFLCPNERRYILSQMAVDVSCDLEDTVFSLSLEGSAAPHVCSIYVSKGRNVALRQAANQSSTHEANGTADKAVDGNRNQDYRLGSCSHTKNGTGPAEWSLYFNQPYTVYSVVIYNRAAYPERLKNFTLMTYNEKGQVTNRWREDDENMKYVIQMNSRAPIVALKIRLDPLDSLPNRLLTLCEVEAYGETFCPDRYYGLSCDKECQCYVSESCSTVTGMCAPGCPIGGFGFMCADNCSPECRTGFCYERLGMCESCSPGFTGAYCSKECDDGKYGLECKKSCSKYCDGVCNKRSGWCKCQPPYTGVACTECERGTYGVNCTKTCPTGCEDKLCHLETGKCVSCSGLRTGISCNECPGSTYGSSCSSNCSIHCLNVNCDPDNGTCPTCVSGYTGPRCNQADVDEWLWAKLLTAIVIFLVLALVTCCFLLQKLCKKFTEAAIEKVDSDAYSLSTSSDVPTPTHI